MVPSDLHEANASVRFCVWHVHVCRQDSRVRAPCGYITSPFVNRMTRAQERSRGREVELDSHSWVDCLAAARAQDRSRGREVELGSHSWVDCLAAARAQDRSRGREVELDSHSWTECLFADRGQERPRAGRWSWALIAGWLVLLLSCSSTTAF